MPMMNSITSKQIAKIWSYSNELGLSLGELHNIVNTFFRKPLRQLSEEEAHRLMTLLSKYRKPNKIVNLISPTQRKRILNLKSSLSWTENELNCFSIKLTGKPYSKLTQEKAYRLIKGLKSLF